MARPVARPTNDPDKAASLYELAKKVGCSYRTVNRLRRQGLEPERNGMFSVARALWFLQNRHERGSYLESASTMAWKERRLKAQALREEIDLTERTRQLVAIVDVRRAWGIQTTQVENAFVGMGEALAPLLAQKGPMEIQSLIDRRVFEILRELSGENSASASTGK